jgi:hypothetical protein
MSSCSVLLRRKVGGDQFELLVSVAFGDLRHDRAGPPAALEIGQLLQAEALVDTRQGVDPGTR